MELIHHYTSIDSLECILKKRTLRFTRLDMLDDAQERELVSRKYWSKYLFVSSWSLLEDESQAMWHSYAGYNGVRIGLPKHPFAEFPIRTNKELNFFVRGELKSPLPLEQIYNEQWLIINSPHHKDFFGKPVTYYKNPEEHIKPVVQHADGGILFNYNDLALSKSNIWKYQEEFRYIYFLIPSHPSIVKAWKSTGDPRYIYQYTYECLQNQRDNPFTYFDSPLGDALNHIEVTIGPTCNEDEISKIKQLVSDHTTHGEVHKSELTGFVKN